VLVGSSMGGWIMLLAALQRPDRVAGLVGIASAPDFTELLLRRGLDDSQQESLARDGRVILPSAYLDEPTIITNHLLEEGCSHLILDGDIAIHCPMRLLHSLDDPDVPWRLSLEIQQRSATDDIHLTLLKDAGHRLSRPQDISLTLDTIAALLDELSPPE
jgi:pimeloyl-ACP methyl ester carboxylesterase